MQGFLYRFTYRFTSAYRALQVVFNHFREAKKKLGFNVLSLKSELMMERDTSLELATYCLGSSHSTG